MHPALWVLICLVTGAAVAAAGAVLHRRAARARLRSALDHARREHDESQVALMRTLAGGLAHEIRNPLSTLSMNLQLLKEEWANPVSEREQRSRKRIDVLLREVQRLEGILNDFLRFAAGHELHLAPVNLHEMAAELLDLIGPQAEHADIRVRRNLSPARTQADANLIRSSLLNLLVNAQQAMPKGGEIEVTTRMNGTAAVIQVRDTGEGIPPENLDKIFNLYFSTKPGGTGLGLPMVKRIVEEHRGTVDVESRVGAGTTFTMRLPA